MKVNNFTVPVGLPIANGATTPAPAGGGVIIWSTITNALLTWDGTKWGPIQAGASATWTPITIDLGTTPVYDKLVTIARPGLLPGAIISMVQSSLDDIEMDIITTSAGCYAADVLTISMRATPGPISGVRYFNLKVE